MKRGLKDQVCEVQDVTRRVSSCYNRYPDEKGTERPPAAFRITDLSYNRYPDEKGTERIYDRLPRRIA